MCMGRWLYCRPMSHGRSRLRDEKIQGGERTCPESSSEIAFEEIEKEVEDQTPESARQPAGGGAGRSGARRCSVRAVPDLRHRPAAERLVGRQHWPGHHPSRHPSRPRHPGPREGHRAEPQCSALTPPPSSPWVRRRRWQRSRRGVRHQHRRCPAELHPVRKGSERQL